MEQCFLRRATVVVCRMDRRILESVYGPTRMDRHGRFVSLAKIQPRTVFAGEGHQDSQENTKAR